MNIQRPYKYNEEEMIAHDWVSQCVNCGHFDYCDYDGFCFYQCHKIHEINKKTFELIKKAYSRKYGNNKLSNIFTDEQLEQIDDITYKGKYYKKCYGPKGKLDCGKFYKEGCGQSSKKYWECWRCVAIYRADCELEEKFKKIIKMETFWH